MTERQVFFAPFRLDIPNRRLYRGDEWIALRPKSWAVLHYLIANPGRSVTKDELLGAVWPETAVSDTVLKVCVRELREALGAHSNALVIAITALTNSGSDIWSSTGGVWISSAMKSG